MAVNEHRTGDRLDRFDDPHGLLSGNAIIADRRMDVPNAEASRRFGVRPSTIDADDLYAEILECRETRLPLGLAPAVETLT
jgi:hypothetical protein